MPLPKIVTDFTSGIGSAAAESGVVQGVRGFVGSQVDRIEDRISDITDGVQAKVRQAWGDIFAGVGKVVNKVAPAALSAMATLEFKGTQGSFCSVTQPLRLVARFTGVTNDRHDRIGWPVMNYCLMNELSGFVLCENAVVEIPGTLSEKQAVEAFMNGGFYIE